MSRILIGHHADNDGFCAFEIAKRAYKQRNPNVFIKGMWLMRTQSDDKFLNEIKEDDTVIVLDYSFDIDKMKAIQKKVADRFVLIDHHETCYNAIQADPTFKFKGVVSPPDQKVAGCELTWKCYYKDAPMPAIVTALGSFDTWRFPKSGADIPEDLAVEIGLKTVLSTMDWREKEALWDKLLITDPVSAFAQVKAVGNIVCKSQYSEMEYMTKNAPVINVEGQDFKFLNTSNITMLSYWGDCNTDKISCPVMTFNQSTRGVMRISVRSCGKLIDCAKFCELFGGGGHRGSAGFTMSWSEFIEFCQLYKIDKIGLVDED